jgi:hypothetical protein
MQPYSSFFFFSFLFVIFNEMIKSTLVPDLINSTKTYIWIDQKSNILIRKKILLG